MSKGDTHDDFDLGPEFEINFQKNIENILNMDNGETDDAVKGDLKNQPDKDEISGSTKTEDNENNINIVDKQNKENKDNIGNEKTLGKNSSYEASSDKGKSDNSFDNSLKESSFENENFNSPQVNSKEENTSNTDAVNESPSVENVSDEKIEAEEPGSEDVAAMELAAAGETLDETLSTINDSLAKQISEELQNLEVEQKKKKKRARMMKVQIGIMAGLLVLLGMACFLGFTKPGNKLLLKMGINIGGKIWDAWTQDFTDNTDVEEDVDYLDEEDIASTDEEIDPDTIVWPEHPGYGRQEEGVYNILLLGEEAIGSGSARGRTDVIIIATLNKNQKSIKLTSLMRDLLVQIPGYKDNKLNSAYEKGGIDLLYETIALNFNIRLDGCVLVNFENFEKIIDLLGGLEITLTKGEAKYLNSTNYISNPKYRNVKEGKQLMNGNQVLGYARIRKRAAITGNNNDYGRTDRHRIILNAIFEKYKTKSEMELVSIMFKVLPLVKTDIDSKTFEKLINTFIEMGTMEIEQLRIPADGTFTDNVKVRGMDVLIPDLTENTKILHEFIFGN
ncbi:MAG TPA: LCP family protein [Mobilitalea sp.]|nr:LCP family protein [Mobilitalea sp.]